MKLETRYAASPREMERLNTTELREQYLVESIFIPGDILLTYTHNDRMIFGGVTLIFSDITFIKMKAVILNLGIGIGFLVTPLFNKERLPIIHKMLGSMLDLTRQGWMRLNWAWCGQFFLLAGLHFFFGFLYMNGKYWGEFTAFGDIIVSLSYLAVILFCLRKHFKTAE